MNSFINRIANSANISNSFSNSSKQNNESVLACNYTNNYYGDQVCFQVKPSKPRNNLHVAIQL